MMPKTITKLITFSTVFSFLLLSACGGGGGDGDNGSSGLPSGGVSVLTVSGGTVPLDGTYQSQCHLSDDGLAYLVFTLAITGNNVVMTADAYSNTNTTCTGAPLQTQNAGFNLIATSTAISTTGWTDGNSGIIAPPFAADGSGPLSNMESVTLVNYTVTSAGIIFTLGETGQIFFVFDDTDAMPVMYLSDSYPSTSLVETVPTYVKQ